MLTQEFLDNLKPDGKTHVWNDKDGLELKQSRTGLLLWRHLKKDEGQERLRIGYYPDVTLAAAREKNLELKAKVETGADISAFKKEKQPLLTDEIIAALKPGDKPVFRHDQNGLYYVLWPEGRATWMLDSRKHKKRITLGKYPDMSIEDARETQERYMALLERGIDPRDVKEVTYALTDDIIREAQCPENQRIKKLTDQRGLCVRLWRSGAKSWVFEYTFDGKEHDLALGEYPDVSISMARNLHEKGLEWLAQGKDPRREFEAADAKLAEDKLKEAMEKIPLQKKKKAAADKLMKKELPKEVIYKLTNKIVAALKPKATVYQKADQRGLTMEVHPSGRKVWLYRWETEEKAERTFKIGEYPDMSLTDARHAHEKLLKLRARGGDPQETKVIEYKLTDELVKSFEGTKSGFQKADQRGLLIHVRESGYMPWHLRYPTATGREEVILGAYPKVNLDQARQMQELALELITAGTTDIRSLLPLPVVLTEGIAHNAPYKDAAYSLYGADGIQLDIAPGKPKEWTLAYTFKGKNLTMSLGKHPAISFRAAQAKQRKVAEFLAVGIDPQGGTTEDFNRKSLQQDSLPQLYKKDEAAAGKPYMIAYQRNDLRYLVYLDDRPRIFEVIDAEKDDIRPMTDIEAAASIGRIRRELSPADLAKVEEDLIISELRIPELTGEKKWKPKQDAPKPEKIDGRKPFERRLAAAFGAGKAQNDAAEAPKSSPRKIAVNFST